VWTEQWTPLAVCHDEFDRQAKALDVAGQQNIFLERIAPSLLLDIEKAMTQRCMLLSACVVDND